MLDQLKDEEAESDLVARSHRNLHMPGMIASCRLKFKESLILYILFGKMNDEQVLNWIKGAEAFPDIKCLT